ncbi:MAG: hypothetical protein K2O24_07115 [Muribaculaceae bacterium]|nr:hypothetical protein [Muribaculaceae bacterium]
MSNNNKSGYAGLWALLVVALAVVMAVSFHDDITIGKWTVKKAPFKETLTASAGERMEKGSAGDTPYGEAPEEGRGESIAVVQTDSAPQSLLIIGDSMTLNLALRLAEYAKHNGHEIHAVNWDSSNTKIWASCDTLDAFINRYDVTYVFISLGSNELYLKNFNSRRPYIETILSKIGDIPYVWIGPPNWKEDMGMNDLLAEMCRPGAFFRTEGMKLDRKKDHIHPTRAASALWIDSVARWMPKSAHPILMETPPDTIGKANAHVTYLKALNK